MAVSLNAIKRPIAYDTRIDYYIDSYKFAGELILSLQLSVLLPSLNECYCVEVDKGAFQCDFLNQKRRVVIAGTRNWISDLKKEKIRDYSIGTANCYTSLVIAIEIKKEEISSCINMFSIDAEGLTRLSEDILQNALEITLYRYNEKTNGSSFLTPSVEECDRIDIGFYINFIEKRLHRCHFIPFHFPLVGTSEIPIDKEAFAQEVHNWRYFFSKASYDYKTKKYLDSIIAAAISIESYAWEIVCSSLENDEKIEEYTSIKDENGEKHHLSATQLYKKLKDDGKLNTNLSKTKIESFVQTILNPRNDIMHGKKTVAISWKEIATKVNSTLTSFYQNLNEPTDEVVFLEATSFNEDIVYRDYVLKCRNNSFASPELMKNESEEMIRRFPQMDLPRIQEIKALLEMNFVEEAERRISSLFSDIHDPCSTAVDLCNEFIKTNNIDIGIRLFTNIGQLDIRAATALSILYLRDYQKNNNVKSLETAHSISGVCLQGSTKSILATVIAREIAIEISDRNSVEALSKELIDLIQSDYAFPLYCAEYAINTKNYSDAITFLSTCVDRFSNSIHYGLKIDFYFIKFDISDINNRIKNALSICEQEGFSIPYSNEITVKIEEATHKKRSGYYIVTDISSMGKGEMPLGNLIYKDLPFIPGGYFIFK